MTWWIKWDIGNEFPANGRDEWNRNLVLFLLTTSFMIFYTGTKLRNIFSDRPSKNISGMLSFYYDWEIRSFYLLKFMKFYGQFQIHFYKILSRCYMAEIQLKWRITPNNQSIWYNVFIERILTYNDSCFHQNRLQKKVNSYCWYKSCKIFQQQKS